jgi:hypothetical protein
MTKKLRARKCNCPCEPNATFFSPFIHLAYYSLLFPKLQILKASKQHYNRWLGSLHFNDVRVGMCSGSFPKVFAPNPASPAHFRPLVLPCAELCETPTQNFQLELTCTPGGSAGARVFRHAREPILLESATSDPSNELAVLM